MTKPAKPAKPAMRTRKTREEIDGEFFNMADSQDFSDNCLVVLLLGGLTTRQVIRLTKRMQEDQAFHYSLQ